jgi:hypothetical protein
LNRSGASNVETNWTRIEAIGVRVLSFVKVYSRVDRARNGRGRTGGEITGEQRDMFRQHEFNPDPLNKLVT